MKPVDFWSIFFSLVCLLIVTASAQRRSPVVQTKTGAIRGRLIELSPVLQVYEFTGIPYAEPPTGQRRFKKTVPKVPWGSDVFDATRQPNACPQLPFGAGISNEIRRAAGFERWTAKGQQSEDCLTLNIWVPRAMLDSLSLTPNEPPPGLAVYTFIHGGGFSNGGSTIDLYNGAVMAAYNNIVVATIQYRLGSLGFAYYGTEEAPGNMGLWDQLEAMKWMCENIGSFGGNCSETTIGGESAGSMSVSLHLLSPYSRKYFKRAIMESGASVGRGVVQQPQTLKTITDLVYQKAASRAICGDVNAQASARDKIACLRQIDSTVFPLADLAPAMAGYSFGLAPVVDGDFIPRDPMTMLMAGDFYRCPLLLGFNKDEGSMFMLLPPAVRAMLPLPPDTENSLQQMNFTHYNALLTAVMQLASGPMPVDPVLFGALQLTYWPKQQAGYPTGSDVVNAVVQALGDMAISCPVITWAQVASTFGKMGSQIYAYYFSERPSGHPSPSWMGSMHGDEMYFIFGEPLANYSSGYGYSRDHKFLSRMVMAYFTNFIKMGDPNCHDVDTLNIGSIGTGVLQERPWPPFVGLDCDEQIVELSSTVQVYDYGPGSAGRGVVCGLKTRECMFWNLFFPKLYALVAKAGGAPSNK